MKRGAIIIFLVNYCAFLFSQPITFSRVFETTKKNVPLAIISKHSNYFHVLRYNKEVHDFTLERRDKTSSEIIAFTPLKLDIINADWFNYENLDYLFFENNHKVYFVFEKVQNFKRAIFLKVVDTTGKSSDFIELAALDKDKSVVDFKFEFKKTADKKVLVIGSQEYAGSVSKKVVLLYDPEQLEKVWVKKLPAESPATGYSYGFECNTKGDLFYILLRAKVEYYKRKYVDHRQVDMPVFSHELIAMAGFLNGASAPKKTSLAAGPISKLYSVCLYPTNKEVYATLHFSKITDAGEEKIFFLTQKWDAELNTSVYEHFSPLNERIEKQLTFYDGTDYKDAADKDYSIYDKYVRDGSYYILSERKDENFYKELLLIKVDLATGILQGQEIIPRKIFYYKDRTRYKHMGQSTEILCSENYHTLVLENARNLDKQPQDFRYHKFPKVGGLGGANLISYSLKPNGDLEKKFLYENDDYDYIPLQTESATCDVVLYLNRGKFEKFAILKLNP